MTIDSAARPGRGRPGSPWTQARRDAQIRWGVDRFWSRVEKGPGCWLWTGLTVSNNPRPYGVVGFNGRSWLTHRLAYFLTYGPFDLALDVCHHCDNPSCVRPDHLFLGTRRDNMQDAARKGRIVRAGLQGSANPAARLTEAQVREARARFARGGVTKAALAADLGVSQTHMARVLSGANWR